MGHAMTISLINLSAGYDRHPAVHHVSGTFAEASLTAIVGPNGGGKSTLLKALIGFLRPMTGSINYHGVSLRAIAYLPQHSEIDRSFPINVLDVVSLGHWPHSGFWKGITEIQLSKVYAALKQVGMEAFAERPIAALSAGQWQRVLFARLIVQDARVILLDEPFTNIDDRTTHDLMHILQHWQKEGRTVVTATHDLPFVQEHFPEALMIARELVGWGATKTVLRDENLSKAATLAENWVEHAHECERDDRLSA